MIAAASAIMGETKSGAMRRRASEGENHRILAEEFGMSRPTVSVIVNHKTWREVA